MESKETIKLSELRHIGLLCASIPVNRKAVGFRADSKLISVAEDIKAQIEFHIGDELLEIKTKIEAIVKSIQAPLIEKFEIESKGMSEDEKKDLEKSLNNEIAIKVANNPEIKTLQSDELKLWEMEVEKDIPVVELDYKDYDERFPGEPKKVAYMDREFLMDGYDALLILRAKKVVEIIEPEPVIPFETPSTIIQKEIDQLTNN